MKIAIFANDDLTSNLIFAPLFALSEIEIVSLNFAASPRKGMRSSVLGALALLKRMSFRYWLFLAFTNGLFKIFEFMTLLLRLSPRYGQLVSLRRLAAERGLAYDRIVDFSAPEAISEIKAKSVDLVLIRIGDILKPNLLEVPRLGVWCIHSSLLPSFKGIAGEFHALRTKGSAIGSTVFMVAVELDGGDPLAQVRIARQESKTVFHHMVCNNLAAARLLATTVKRTYSNLPATPLLNEGLKSSYYGWPQPGQVASLRDQGIRLMTFREFFQLFSLCIRLYPFKFLP